MALALASPAVPAPHSAVRVFAPPATRDLADERWADAVVQALLQEARLAPKPGLVDARGAGAHDDLTLALMERSARALHPFFAQMARRGAGADRVDLELREHLGSVGRNAESAMLAETGGVNTHRGAIWALGLLVAAAALEGPAASPARIAATAGAIASLPDCHAPSWRVNKGAIACQRYHVGGARSQASRGFPQVMEQALPTLRTSRERGDSEAAARVNALLSIMCGLDDTCVLSRGGPAALAGIQSAAQAVLRCGGIGTLEGRRRFRALDALARKERLSPGGAADLLAATLFLDALEGPQQCAPSTSANRTKERVCNG